MTLTMTRTDTTSATENRGLVLRAFAALSAPGRVDGSDVYAPDVEFLGPARELWTAGERFGNRCVEIERIDAEQDRVVTHATLRADSGREARGLFVHSIGGGRITKVSSVLRWS